MVEVLGRKNQKINVLMSGKYNQSGFSFLQLIILLFVIGLLMRVVIPNVQTLFPRYERQAFIGKLSALVQYAWLQALITQKVHRIFFDVEKRIIRIEKETTHKNNLGTLDFQPIVTPYIKTEISMPMSLKIEQFFIDGAEYIKRAGIQTEHIWFFIMPDGLCQTVVINMIDVNHNEANSDSIGLTLNPFTGRFSQYESFQKPL